MSNRPLLLLLVFWNLLLTGAIIWSLTRARVPDRILKEKLSNIAAGDTLSDGTVLDTARMAEGNIAFFFMDSVQSQFELVKESTDRVRSEGKRMENALQREMDKAQGRYQTLMSKDHTYSTQAELAKDQAELEQLGQKIQEMRSNSQDQLDLMQAKMLEDITGQIRGFLEDFNKTAGYDYIFSIQDAGQIWVGNKGLNITPQLVKGLNERHHARQAEPAK
ncbi:MAG: OmpH family outer membrane protein [Flavobacteriales bacterium]|jgi:Skp family chaperone for outer membrane proteins|nr:OmpH family outer membrane protein [Flavobacteriales bacterium]